MQRNRILGLKEMGELTASDEEDGKGEFPLGLEDMGELTASDEEDSEGYLFSFASEATQ